MKIMVVGIIIIVTLFSPLYGEECDALPLDAKVEVMRAVVHAGEPIAIRLTLKNVGTTSVVLHEQAYPEIGVRWGDDIVISKDAPISPELIERLVALRKSSGICRQVLLRPQETRSYCIALNRYYLIKGETDKIRYTVELRGSLHQDDGSLSEILVYKKVGVLKLNVEPGEIDQEWIRELAAIATGKAEGDAAQLSKQEAAELLCWAETPLIIEPLTAAAKDPGMPNLLPEAIRALGRFFKTDTRVRAAIIELAEIDGQAFAEARKVFEREGELLPKSLLKTMCNSRSPSKIIAVLQYLEKHGTREDAAFVTALTDSQNPQIAELARSVLAIVQARGETVGGLNNKQ